MGVGQTERGVAVSRIIVCRVVRLIGGAVRRPADDRLAIGRGELGVDVNRCGAS